MNDLAQPVESSPQAVGPGATLRALREARGLTVDGAAQALKLARRQVEAIEAEDFAALKGPTFARGFVRNYAKLLQTDAAPLLAQIDQLLAHREVVLLPPSNASGDMPDSSASRGMPRSLAILAATAFVGLLALMAYDHYSESVSRSGPKVAPAVVPKPLAQTAESAPPAVAPTEPSPPSAAPPAERASSVPSQPGEPAMLQPAAGIAQAQPAPVQAAPASKPAEPGVHRLSFQFGRDSWVEVKDAEGKVLMSRTLPAGTSQVIEGRAPLSLVIGNAQHVELMLDDQPVDLVPHTGQSVARLKLP